MSLMKKGYWSAIGLALVMTLASRNRALAAGPPEDGPDPNGDRWVGLTSTTVECLVVRAGMPDSATATVRLEWEGQVEEALLVLSAAGSQGGHSIYVNGRRVGNAPVRPGGQPCQAGSSVSSLIPTASIPIPAEVLVKGENVITLTNDANINDGWTAANLHLEIHGILSGPPVAVLEASWSALSPSEIRATAVISDSDVLTSSYDGIPQVVWYQIPDVYTTTIPAPLLIGVHGMGSTGQWIRDYLAAEANDRGWLLAAPDMHGRYYTNDGRYALGWIGAQHDIVDTVEYMMSEYAVDPSRIYITGGSMGGQTTAMMVAKYPDMFPAAAPWKPLTDLTDWYNELGVLGRTDIRLIIRNETGGTPSGVPFEYQRRSPIAMPQNSRLTPIKIWHDQQDVLVPIHHSYDLRDAINNFNPPTPVVVIDPSIGGCPPDQHCYNPTPAELLDYLEGFTLSSQPPPSLTIRTDESKPYYWLNVAQTGDDHWSEVEAAYSLADKTVIATVSDIQPLNLGFNLGSMPITGAAGISQPGMGLPATTYLIKGGGNYALANYTSDYLTATLTATGQFSLSISAVEAKLSAKPDMVLGWEATTSTITAVLEDRLSNPVPDGTGVRFSTSEGTFPNESSTYTATVTGGQATATLTLTPPADSAEIIASVESITGSTSVDVIHPAIDILVTPNPTTVRSGQDVTYTYQITNTGDVTLTAVTVVDDHGTVCESITVAAKAAHSCTRGSPALFQTTTITATATGQDPLGNDVSDSDSTTVSVISPAIDLLLTPHQTTIYKGEFVTYTYRITNTGDVTLTGVTVVDGDSTVCAGITLTEEGAQSCMRRSPALYQTTTTTATVTGQDPLGYDVTNSDSTTVIVKPWEVEIYLPIIARSN